MPQRKITIPAPIQFVDPDTGEVVQGPPFDFARFLVKLTANPMWNDSWKHGLAQRGILAAFKEAASRGEATFMIAEEDWEFLVEAAKNPRSAIRIVDQAGNVSVQIMGGIGFSPSVASQILPMQLAIIEAVVV